MIKNYIKMASISMIMFTRIAVSQSNITYDAGTAIDIGAGADVCADQVIINGTLTGSGTICGSSSPGLFSFNFSVNKSNVLLTWVTSEENSNSGFDIERKNGPNNWVRVAFVQGNGTSKEPKSYFYIDKNPGKGIYKYRLKQTSTDGNFEYFDLNSDVVVDKPIEFSISQNYPNPSNPNSKIDYQIPFDGLVTVKVYDITGREVAILVNKTQQAGYYTTEFDGTNIASGVYFYKITASGNGSEFSKILKLVLVK